MTGKEARKKSNSIASYCYLGPTMSTQLINNYYNHLASLRRVGLSSEGAIRPPFDALVQQFAQQKRYIYAQEVTLKNQHGKNIRPDGVLMNDLRIHKGYTESKDSDDTLDAEIHKKLHRDGYPSENILFQDGATAVLIQRGEEAMRVNMTEADRLEAVLRTFVDFKPDYIKEFERALEKFKADIPTIVETLRTMIEEQNQTNERYKGARDAFWAMCQQEINPNITLADIREMIIQHVLTEDLFKSVFNEADFHRENNVARELEALVNTFMTREVRQNQLGELNHYYDTLNAQAAAVADHHEKQRFLKVVYENFYKVYNPKGADRLGVVYTPNEIVDFMIRSTDHLLEKHFGRHLHDQNVHILDPATGTGTFITDIIEYIPTQYLEHKYRHEIHANEVAILPYYVANLNIEFTYKQRMGRYAEFPNICFVDTLDNTGALRYVGKQAGLFGMSTENAERIERQNQHPISVIIGNPPYNANQASFNDFNKNREYWEDYKKKKGGVDGRIKDTFVRESTAQKTKVYDMYARFYRWAMDRIDQNGVIAFITNRSFIDSRTFDGFRKCVQDQFDYAYVIDTHSDVRANPKIAGTTHNVFGIQTGVAMMFLVRKEVRNEVGCQIYYNGEMRDEWRKEEKLAWINERQFSEIAFTRIAPSKKNNWVNLAESDFEELLPLLDKQVKNNSSDNAIFRLYTSMVKTNRDEWVYDYDRLALSEKVKYFIKEFNTQLTAKNDENLVNTIKWSSTLTSYLEKNIQELEFKEKLLLHVLWRPYISKYYYSEKVLSDRLTHFHYQIFGSFLEDSNKIICFNGFNTVQWNALATNKIIDYNSLYGGIQCLPLYRYDSKGNRHDNITDWGLMQFQQHYARQETKSNGALPPDSQATLEVIRQDSQTLPVLQKHGEQLSSQLSALTDYSAESLAPVRETITTFQQTLAQRERDAVERKALYQRLRSSLSDLQTQLAQLAPASRRARDITKEAIFHYTYGVLHDPAYRQKYALNLKRDFPRLPFYADFWQWADWGKALMELHLRYETAKPYGLRRVDRHVGVKGSEQNQLFEAQPLAVLSKLKVKLRAKKDEGVIELDEQTVLHGVPAEAWEYQLGNRSALEWVLDQYKEKKPRDATIAERFNTYRFADYKEQVIDLLQRVCTVSVATMKIIREMEARAKA